MNYIKSFELLSKNDVEIAGGKGASLGEMTRAKFPVPPGFVVLSSAFNQFIRETDLNIEIDAALDKVNHKEIHTVENASEKIQTLIINSDFPEDLAQKIYKHFKKLNSKFVAVRSSATSEDSSEAAWAGQLDSYLNTTGKELLNNIKKCWASLFTPRAIFYRFEKNLHKTKISVAVVVQKMIESEISGIAFSVHPVTQDYNQIIIEAGLGLGEAIVSGSVTPDSYVVEKNSKKIIDINVGIQTKALYRENINGGNVWEKLSQEIGSKQVLNKSKIIELSDIIFRIEKHYKFPCDIEWAYESGKFYIVQSRPITTLDKIKDKNNDEKIKNIINYNGKIWSLGVTRNMSFLHQYMSSFGHVLNSKDFGIKTGQLQVAFTEHGDSTSIFTNPENMARYADDILLAIKTPAKIKTLKKKYQEFALDLLKATERLDKEKNKAAWVNFSRSYQRLTAGLYLTVVIGRTGSDLLIKKLKDKNIAVTEISTIINLITYPQEHTPLFNSQLDLLKLAANYQAKKITKEKLMPEFTYWLSKYGHIPVNFCNDPWTIKDTQLQFNAFLKKDCAKEVRRYLAEHQKKVALKNKKLKEINSREISNLAYALAEGTYLNEFRKNVFSNASLGYRGFLQLIANKSGSKNWRDCFYLTPNEIAQISSDKKINLKKIKKERQNIAYYVNEEKKMIILNNKETRLIRIFIAKSHGGGRLSEKTNVISNEIKGYSANRGKITGIAKIILNSKDFYKLKRGEILVTTMTSVDFVPIMERAGAFITNEGGITSHASIVAREMDKPCIIGTGNATQILKDGDRIDVDADNGLIRLLINKK